MIRNLFLTLVLTLLPHQEIEAALKDKSIRVLVYEGSWKIFTEKNNRFRITEKSVYYAGKKFNFNNNLES